MNRRNRVNVGESKAGEEEDAEEDIVDVVSNTQQQQRRRQQALPVLITEEEDEELNDDEAESYVDIDDDSVVEELQHGAPIVLTDDDDDEEEQLDRPPHVHHHHDHDDEWETSYNVQQRRDEMVDPPPPSPPPLQHGAPIIVEPVASDDNIMHRQQPHSTTNNDGGDDDNNSVHGDIDDDGDLSTTTTLSLSRAPEIVLPSRSPQEEEDESLDMSSVGMGSAAGGGKSWDEQPHGYGGSNIMPPSSSSPRQQGQQFTSRQRQRRHYYSWTPSYSYAKHGAGRSGGADRGRRRRHRWESHPAFHHARTTSLVPTNNINTSSNYMRPTRHGAPIVLHEDHNEEAQTSPTSIDLEAAAAPSLTNIDNDVDDELSSSSIRPQQQHPASASSSSPPLAAAKSACCSQSNALLEEDESNSDTKTNESHTTTGQHDDGDNDNADLDVPPLSVASPYTLLGAPDSKYACYHCVVDSSQEDRAVEIQLASVARPHMRAFHLAWLAFFVAFFTWFALTPLLSEIAISLSLDKQEIWTSSIFGVAGSAVTRILIGPICDVYGARWAMGGTLFLSGIPMALTGLVQTGIGLSILRLFIGLAGSAFVTSQYWSSSMFTREVAGTANAIVAGWGNLGGGVTQLVMGSLVFPLLKILYGGDGWTRAETRGGEDTNNDVEYDRASDLAWRTSCVVPASMCFAMTYFVICKSDDCPKGNYHKRNRDGFMPSVSARQSILFGMRNLNTWILFIQYGCCFGVEITMVNAAALYFKEEFGLSTEVSAAVASIFGWMNLFARGLGGFLSDISNAKLGMRGRLWCQVVTLLAEGALVVVFSKTVTLGGAIIVMIAFSIFVQSAEGSTYGIVPYVNPDVTGSISGIVGAGGNVGGVLFATIFRQLQYRNAFAAMGVGAMISSLCTIPVRIPGHASLFCGDDAPEVLARRTYYMEEMGAIPPVLGAGVDADGSNRRTSVVDRDTSRRSSSVCRRGATQVGVQQQAAAEVEGVLPPL